MSRKKMVTIPHQNVLAWNQLPQQYLKLRMLGKMLFDRVDALGALKVSAFLFIGLLPFKRHDATRMWVISNIDTLSKSRRFTIYKGAQELVLMQ